MIRGTVSRLAGSWLSGWVFDAAKTAPLRVILRDGEDVIAQTMADLDRPDVERRHGRRRCGFRFRLPPALATSATLFLANAKVLVGEEGSETPLKLWSVLQTRLVGQAEAEARLAKLDKLPLAEAVALLTREQDGDVHPEWLDQLLARRPGLAGDPSVRIIRAKLAFQRKKLSDCLAFLDLPVPIEQLGITGADIEAALRLRLASSYALNSLKVARETLASMADRAIEPDAQIGAATRSKTNGIYPELPALATGYSVVLTDHFKWTPQTIQATWGTVFTGTTDEPVDEIETILRLFEAIPEERRQLVTIIGGMWFLRLLGRLRFRRIIAFDLNIAELAKMAHARDYILRTPFEEFDGFRSLDMAIQAHPEAFYLPRSMAGFGIRLEHCTYSYERKVLPAITAISPLDFPDLVWQPSAAEYAMVQANLADGFDQAMHLRPPVVDPTRLTLAFLSHVEFARAELERELGSPFVIPVFARGITNAAALDPHCYWSFVAALATAERPTLHLWSAEDEHLAGGVHDRLFARGVSTGEFLEDGFQHAQPCLLTHLLLSKCAEDRRVGREQMLGVILTAAADHYSRVVVAEQRPSAERANGIAEAVLVPRGYHRTNRLIAPGGHDPERNIFLIYDRAVPHGQWPG